MTGERCARCGELRDQHVYYHPQGWHTYVPPGPSHAPEPRHTSFCASQFVATATGERFSCNCGRGESAEARCPYPCGEWSGATVHQPPFGREIAVAGDSVVALTHPFGESAEAPPQPARPAPQASSTEPLRLNAGRLEARDSGHGAAEHVPAGTMGEPPKTVEQAAGEMADDTMEFLSRLPDEEFERRVAAFVEATKGLPVAPEEQVHLCDDHRDTAGRCMRCGGGPEEPARPAPNRQCMWPEEPHSEACNNRYGTRAAGEPPEVAAPAAYTREWQRGYLAGLQAARALLDATVDAAERQAGAAGARGEDRLAEAREAFWRMLNRDTHGGPPVDTRVVEAALAAYERVRFGGG